MAGIPDGLGAFDNGDGTFTLLMNHELNNLSGVARDHGAIGAFVSRWVIKKTNLQVLHGDDLIKTLYVWDPTANAGAGGFVVGSGAANIMNRLCSADLAAAGAYYNPASGLGTNAAIFMNGEETSATGRAFAHVVTGADAGKSWELPWTGKYAWENHAASPFPQDKTIVVGLDDSSRTFSSEGATTPSEVYIWVGNKQSSRSEIDKAGLGPNGTLYGMRVGTPGSYDANESSVTSGEDFELVSLTDQANNTGPDLQTESIAKTITQFRRVEDAAWDPNNPNDFYFVTTDQYGASGFSKLWRMRFDNIANPTAGGALELLIDGGGTGSNSALGTGEMFDNMTVDTMGRVILQEDVGNQEHLGKIWAYDIASRGVLELGRHDADKFISSSANYIGTQDEESSGVIDVSNILGPGAYLLDDQVHAVLADPELVEPGQLLLMRVGRAAGFGFNAVDNGAALVLLGTKRNDQFNVFQRDADYYVQWRHEERPRPAQTADAGGLSHGEWDLFTAPSPLSRVIVSGNAGNDRLDVSGSQTAASLFGGGGRDDLLGSDLGDYLSGGRGNDRLDGGPGADTMSGGPGADLFWIRSGEGDILVDFGQGNDKAKPRKN